MRDLVASFTTQMGEAIKIGERFTTNLSGDRYDNIVVAGLGGSGIGATMAGNILRSDLKIPFVTNKEYHLPGFVTENTLLIACSYSGNTEETLSAVKEAEQKGCDIVVITTGGELKKQAESKNWPHVILPAGFPPRAAFAYSFTQYFFVLSAIGLIPHDYRKRLNTALNHLKAHESSIEQEAESIAKSCYGSLPVIYATSAFEGATVRWKQQINENSKMLSWQHVIPEMNHNELVGWGAENKSVTAVFLESALNSPKNQKRIDICKEVISKKARHVVSASLKGSSVLEQTFYAVLLGDWVSVYLAEMKEIDPIEVDIIDYLKSNLKNVSSESK